MIRNHLFYAYGEIQILKNPKWGGRNLNIQGLINKAEMQHVTASYTWMLQ